MKLIKPFRALRPTRELASRVASHPYDVLNRQEALELAAGRFHYYCLDSQACPLVRKAEAAGRLPASQIFFMRFWTRWYWLDRRLGGLPGKYLFTPAKWATIRLLRITSEKGYLGRILARYWRRLRGAEA